MSVITNAVLAKKAIFDLLKAQAIPAGFLPGVAVDYAYNGTASAPRIYGGGWRFDPDGEVAEGPGVVVQELIGINVYVEVVVRPAVDVFETDLTAAGIAGAIGQTLKAAPQLTAQLRVRGIASGQGGYERTDDETISRHIYQVLVSSYLAWG